MSDLEDGKRTKRNNNVMLWGKKKASQSQIDDVLKNLKIKVEKKEKPTKKGAKTVKQQRTHYDPTLEYTIDDIDFLEQELEKLNDDYENQKFDRLEDSNVKKYYDIKKNIDDDEKEEILYKMIDKLERLIEILKDYQGEEKNAGEGVHPIIKTAKEKAAERKAEKLAVMERYKAARAEEKALKKAEREEQAKRDAYYRKYRQGLAQKNKEEKAQKKSRNYDESYKRIRRSKGKDGKTYSNKTSKESRKR